MPVLKITGGIFSLQVLAIPLNAQALRVCIQAICAFWVLIVLITMQVLFQTNGRILLLTEGCNSYTNTFGAPPLPINGTNAEEDQKGINVCQHQCSR